MNPWIVAGQAPLSMECFRQEHWSGLHFVLQGIFLVKDQTQISCISCTGRQILYHWTTWETQPTLSFSIQQKCCLQVELVLLLLCCFYLLSLHLFLSSNNNPFPGYPIFNGKSFQQCGYLNKLYCLSLLFVFMFNQLLPTGESE